MAPPTQLHQHCGSTACKHANDRQNRLPLLPSTFHGSGGEQSAGVPSPPMARRPIHRAGRLRLLKEVGADRGVECTKSPLEAFLQWGTLDQVESQMPRVARAGRWQPRWPWPYPVGQPTWRCSLLLPVAGIAIPAALTRVAAGWNRLPSEPGWLCPASFSPYLCPANWHRLRETSSVGDGHKQCGR
jgi:hypothetical protein